MSTKITKIKKLSFVAYQDVKDTDMMWILRRNEVKIVGERTIEVNPFHQRGPRQGEGVFGDLIEEMYDFCNDNCKGIWTYTYLTEFKNLEDRSMSYHGSDESLMVGTMSVFFELREDRDAFMKNHILLAKLAQE
jgi:hypothetical protein